MKNKNIIPTVFSHSKKEFDERFNKILKASDKIQIDFMDGKFVSAKSVSFDHVPKLKKYKKEFEAHLMVSNPLRWVQKCKEKGFSKVIFHIESCKNHSEADKIIDFSKELGLIVYPAINPKTSFKKIVEIIQINPCEGIMFLGVNPGKEGQKLSWKITRRIKRIKKIFPKIVVQVDGGVNEKNASKLSKAGADLLNSGSFVSNSEKPKSQINLLQGLFDTGKKQTSSENI